MYPDLPFNSLSIPLLLNFLNAYLSSSGTFLISFYPSSNRVYCLCIEPRISRKILLYFRTNYSVHTHVIISLIRRENKLKG